MLVLEWSTVVLLQKRSIHCQNGSGSVEQNSSVDQKGYTPLKKNNERRVVFFKVSNKSLKNNLLDHWRKQEGAWAENKRDRA